MGINGNPDQPERRSLSQRGTDEPSLLTSGFRQTWKHAGSGISSLFPSPLFLSGAKRALISDEGQEERRDRRHGMSMKMRGCERCFIS